MILLKIVGLNPDKVFYLVKVHGEWKQYTKPITMFVNMMYVLFPHLVKEAQRYDFDNYYSIANWLYNYREEVKPCETYIFMRKSR